MTKHGKFWAFTGLATALLLAVACSSSTSDALFGTTNVVGQLHEGVNLSADPEFIGLNSVDPDAPRDPDTGLLIGSTTLTAQILDAQLDPIVGVEVTFSASAGNLASEGNPLTTDDQGMVTDTLDVDEEDLGDVEVLATSGDFSDMIIVPVVLLEPPVADAGEDQIVECATSVLLDGSGSSDPNDDIVSWEWFVGDEKIAEGETAQVELPVGETVVTLVVTDAAGLSDSDEVTITIEDTTPPVVMVHVNPNVLWPPNHKMRDIEVRLAIDEACDPEPTVELVSVTSNEPANDIGDGNTEPDIMGAEIGTEDYSFQLRAERQGPGTGRIYTVVYRVTDASGNVGEGEATITVPHDQGNFGF